tara:strand:- start:294 stop:584 length:291 start_codon:yes stop_codon:yes gene_type:complete
MGASGMTYNIQMGVNALRCAVVSGAATSWYFIASAWWALYWAGQEGLLEEALDVAYPYVCTCVEDVNELSKVFGGTDETAEVFGTCSESSSNLTGM